MTREQEIYEKFQKGDPLLDVELEQGLDFFTNLALDLNKAGPVFRLAANEANRVRIALNAYRMARKKS